MATMNTIQSKLDQNYWNNFQIGEEDLEFLYGYLLEVETPLTSLQLLEALIANRIQKEQQNIEKEITSTAQIYLPKEKYQIGQTLTFPSLGYQKGQISAVRPGINPDVPDFEVLVVEMETGEERSFASSLDDHALNLVQSITDDNPFLNPVNLVKQHGDVLKMRLSETLEQNEGLVQIAGRWFPEALLVDINIGYLNMAEALLEMEAGGPLSTSSILEQIELPTDVNLKLTEFSLNYSLQEDQRFDEVGPAGETQWFLKRLEPEMVREVPIFLQHEDFDFDQEQTKSLIQMLENDVIDELQAESECCQDDEEVPVSLIFPHWRAGTLPLSDRIHRLFPTAYEAPRVQFSFIDADTNETFPGWVVRPSKYVFGLKEWYEQHVLIPGSMVFIRRGDQPGKVVVRCEKRRPNREWVRTALIGNDGGVVFAMLKQLVTPGFNDRMAIAVPETDILDDLWQKKSLLKRPFEKIVFSMLQELAKLNPQGHVHALELYAAVNIVRRCPPGAILDVLSNSSWANHLGDLYFRIEESPRTGGKHD